MDIKLMQGHTSKKFSMTCIVIFDSSVCREWNGDLDAMVKEFKHTSIEQANSYIERDLRNWVVEVSSMNSKCTRNMKYCCIYCNICMICTLNYTVYYYPNYSPCVTLTICK